MTDHDHSLSYHAFVLRCWRERSQQADLPGVWRFSLQDTRTGARQGYATLDALLAALQAALADDESLDLAGRRSAEDRGDVL